MTFQVLLLKMIVPHFSKTLNEPPPHCQGKPGESLCAKQCVVWLTAAPVVISSGNDGFRVAQTDILQNKNYNVFPSGQLHTCHLYNCYNLYLSRVFSFTSCFVMCLKCIEL